MSAAPDPARLALEPALAEVRAAMAPMKALENRILKAMAASGELLPLKEAAFRMNLDLKAARGRAVRGAGFKIDHRWFLSRDYVSSVRATKKLHAEM